MHACRSTLEDPTDRARDGYTGQLRVPADMAKWAEFIFREFPGLVRRWEDYPAFARSSPPGSPASDALQDLRRLGGEVLATLAHSRPYRGRWSWVHERLTALRAQARAVEAHAAGLAAANAPAAGYLRERSRDQLDVAAAAVAEALWDTGRLRNRQVFAWRETAPDRFVEHVAGLVALAAADLPVPVLDGAAPSRGPPSDRDDALARALLEPGLLADTERMIDYFAVLTAAPGSPEAAEAARLFPEVEAYLGAGRDNDGSPLWRHVMRRVLGRKLLGLERADIGVFQTDAALSRQAFLEDAARFRRLSHTGFLPYLRAALLYHDAAKGDPAAFAEALAPGDIDLAVVNKASAQLLRRKRHFDGSAGLFERLALPAGTPRHPVLAELAYQLVDMRGFPGQFVRGELNLEIFQPYTDWVRAHYDELAEALSPGRPDRLPDLLTDLQYLFNAMDTAGVREGIWTDALRAKFIAFFGDFRRVIARNADGRFPTDWADIDAARLAAFGGTGTENRREALLGRFAALRKGRLDEGEDPAALREVLQSLSEPDLNKLWELLLHFKGWYVEDATSALNAEAQVKLLALSAALARRKGMDTSKPYHVNFLPLMRNLELPGGGHDAYKVRIIESRLKRIALPDILEGSGIEAFDLEEGSPGEGGLGAVSMTIDGEKAIAFDFPLSEIGRSLVNLLHHLELRDQAEFHSNLKRLLDLFGIRRDDFDRVNNEAQYLKSMAAAKSDKRKLVDFAKGPTVVEIGPAGGAVLDLLDERKRETGEVERLIGLDVSEEALKDLEKRRVKTGGTYELVHGDAFALRDALKKKGLRGVDTVIFCSILHEIYSYVERDGRRFNKDSVREMLGEALAALNDGGRLLIRDGVIPEDGEDLQVLEIKDRSSFEFFQSYLANFEGRPVPHTVLSNDLAKGGAARVRLRRMDAMEFMYTLTWGPASFPYEVREQYGVMKRSEYVKLIADVAREKGVAVREVPVPAEDRSYLQPGYVDALKDKVALHTLDGQPAPWPDSNMIIVMEATRVSADEGSTGRSFPAVAPAIAPIDLSDPADKRSVAEKLHDILTQSGKPLEMGSLELLAAAAKEQLDRLHLFPSLTGSLLRGGIPIHIAVSEDLTRLVYSKVKSDAGVFQADGTADFSKLDTSTLVEIPSSYLLYPVDYISKAFQHGLLNEITALLGRNQRYTTYDGITVSWDKMVDWDVWTTNIDTVYLHRVLKQAGLLEHPSIRVAMEVGTGGGHLSCLLARDVPNLEELRITDISAYALMASARNVRNYLRPQTDFVGYLGKGIRHIDDKADLIVINPPYIPTPPWIERSEGDPYRGTGLIREIFELGVDRLNPDNPDASIVMNVSNVADQDIEEYKKLYGDRLVIEDVGEPLWVPMKIGEVEKRWLEWLKTRGLQEKTDAQPGQARHWHKLHVLKIRRRTAGDAGASAPAPAGKLVVHAADGLLRGEVKKFPDGEINVKNLDHERTLGADAQVSSPLTSADDAVQLLLALDNLKRSGARSVHLSLEDWSPKSGADRNLQRLLRTFADSVGARDAEPMPEPARKPLPLQVQRFLYISDRFEESSQKAAAMAGARAEALPVTETEPGHWDAPVPAGLSGQNVVLIHATETTENLVKLLLALAALREAGVRSVSVINTYEGYARQDKAFTPGEAVSAVTALKAVNLMTDHHFAINVHYGGKSGFTGLEGHQLYNVNAFPQLAEHLFNYAFQQTFGVHPDAIPPEEKRAWGPRLLEKFRDAPFLLTAPDDGAHPYVAEAAATLKHRIRWDFGVELDVRAVFLDKVRKSSTEVQMSGPLLTEGKRPAGLSEEELSRAWAFVLDDETAQGSTLLSATYVLVEELGVAWPRVYAGVVQGKFNRGLRPFDTGVAPALLKKATRPAPEAVDAAKRRMPPRFIVASESLSLPAEMHADQRVSIQPLITYVVRRIIGQDGGDGPLGGGRRTGLRAIVDWARGVLRAIRARAAWLDAALARAARPAYVDRVDTALGNRRGLFDSLPLRDLNLRHMITPDEKIVVSDPQRDLNLFRLASLFSADGGQSAGIADLRPDELGRALEGLAFATTDELAAYRLRLEAASRRALAEGVKTLEASAGKPEAYKAGEAGFVGSLAFLHGLGETLGSDAAGERLALATNLVAGRRAAGVPAMDGEEAARAEGTYRRAWMNGRWVWERTVTQPFSAWSEATRPADTETPGAEVFDLFDVTGLLSLPGNAALDAERRNLLDRLAASLQAADAMPTEPAKRQALARVHVRWLDGTDRRRAGEVLDRLEDQFRRAGHGALLGSLRRLAPQAKGETGALIDTRRVYQEVAGKNALLRVITEDLGRWTRLSEEEQRRSALRIAFLEILKDGFRIIRPLAELENALQSQQLLDIQA